MFSALKQLVGISSQVQQGNTCFNYNIMLKQLSKSIVYNGVTVGSADAKFANLLRTKATFNSFASHKHTTSTTYSYFPVRSRSRLLYIYLVGLSL